MSRITATALLLSLGLSGHAQQDMKDMKMDGMNMSDSSSHHSMPMEHMGMMMSNSFSSNLPMTRDGSGTSWAPDAASIYGIMANAGKWSFMFHGDIFPRFDQQDINKSGSRGGSIVDAPDMLMAMGQRRVGNKGLFHFNIMLSTDAIITGERGYPLLFQTGESAYGTPLVDRQHPHDLFSELSVSYAYAFNKKTDVFLYVGYPGEPALGPVTFMHRISGEFMPDAPISHHWADATHITFGVATLGVRYRKFKLEGSSFTGREPDENRYDFDKPLFDSWSGRLSYNPSENWALQVSRGFIKSPEALRPDEDVGRTTASATYVYPFTQNNFIAATLLWGQNVTAGQTPSNSALAEATLKLKRLAIYTRYEWVQKSVEELNLGNAYGEDDYIFPVNAITIGAGYDLFYAGPFIVAGGAQASVYHTSNKLNDLYGANPTSAEIYLHIYPKKMRM